MTRPDHVAVGAPALVFLGCLVAMGFTFAVAVCAVWRVQDLLKGRTPPARS